MPAPSKIQDRGEVLRWFEEGRTNQYMVDMYREKYGIKTSLSMWSSQRRRLGIAPALVRDLSLVPWAVRPEHRSGHPVTMLRAEARRRAGHAVPEITRKVLDGWLRQMKRRGVVVHYNPNTPEGWIYVCPREGIDTDLIRVPDRVTGRAASYER